MRQLRSPIGSLREFESAVGATVAVSVIVVSFNTCDLLRDCITSLDHERDLVDVDITVVDNDSHDGSSEMVETEFPHVRLIRAGGNIGFSRANNLALREAPGRYILLLNPDTVVTPGALRAAVEALDRRPEVGMLGCKLVRPDGTLDHACKRSFPSPLSAAAYFLRLEPVMRFLGKEAYTASSVGDDEVRFVDAINGAFMLVRRVALEVVGELDETFWMYGEDLDWCYRFWQAGWPVLYWPEATVIHVKGASTTSHRGWRSNHAFHDAMWLFYRKHYAPSRSRIANVSVWTAINAKLLVSAVHSVAARRLIRVKRR